jgi:replicative DNA helicase
MTASALAPPMNIEAEGSVLGTILLSDRALEPVLVEDGLRPGHFYRPSHSAIFEAMVALHDQDAAVDSLTVVAYLEKTGKLAAAGGKSAVSALVAATDAPGNVRHHARLVIEQAGWRRRRTAAVEMLEAVAGLDENKFAVAERMLVQPVRADDTTKSEEELGHILLNYLEDDTVVGIETPYPNITTSLSGGFRRGACTVVSGWSSMGKSVVMLDCLKAGRDQGLRVHAYTNEMSADEYALRIQSDRANISFSRLLDKKRLKLTEEEMRRYIAAASSMPFAVTDCSGWPAEDIARHIRRNRWDLWGVDLFNRIPAKDTSDWDEIARVLNVVAVQSNSHGLIVAQLNLERDKHEMKPLPVGRDIRSTGMLYNNSANCLFIHRDQEPEMIGGEKTGRIDRMPDGIVYLDKARNGRPGTDSWTKVSLDYRRQRFTTVPA